MPTARPLRLALAAIALTILPACAPDAPRTSEVPVINSPIDEPVTPPEDAPNPAPIEKIPMH
jgi:hypothetical protein